MGQNFLIDANILAILLKHADVDREETVLEPGAGLGVVTRELAARGAGVVAVEKDARLAAYLEEQFAEEPRARILRADMLDVEVNGGICGAERNMEAAAAIEEVGIVAGNLPYSVGSRVLANLFQCRTPPRRMAVTVQYEVARRLAARPGTGDYGLLSLWAQLPYAVKTAKRVGPTCFWPVPEVDSAIVVMERRKEPLPGEDLRASFYSVTKRAFTQRRKQLAALLGGGKKEAGEIRGMMKSLGIDARARPGDLSAEEWLRLCAAAAGAKRSGGAGPEGFGR